MMCPFPVDARPVRWVKVSDRPDATVYIDVESILKEEHLKFYWAKSVYKKRTPISGKGTPLVYSGLSYTYTDCKENIYEVLLVKMLGANDQVLVSLGARDNTGRGIQAIKADTYAEEEKNFVCFR